LVTGANTGIGREAAEVFARRGARVWIASRSREKSQPVVDGIRAAGGSAEFLALDLGDLSSVRRAAETFLATGEPLHVLVNNAGIAGQQGVTRDGFEITFGTNHLGPFLLTTMILPRLRESAPSRIVNVSSHSHYGAKKNDWNRLRGEGGLVGLGEYDVSKLCNVLFTKELARGRAGAGVTSYALHPGVVATDIWQRRLPKALVWLPSLFMKSVEQGALTTIYCATDPALATQDGLYYANSRERRPSRLSQDVDLARELWERSEAWIATGT
jgi:NAD(P)-dependent dehydrogenase (short-subunit alcohol dehydrogenase family)